MKDFDFAGLLRKTEELRALFILGQRVIPFLEELFSFVGEIQPLLDDINNSIKENISKMPNLSQQLSKVTAATELATTEILDIIDGIFYKLDILVNNLNSIRNLSDLLSSLEKVNDVISTVNISSEEKLSLISQLLNHNVCVTPNEFENILKNTFDFIEKIRSDSASIMLALQVQDITSQQIAAVNHLLNTVQERMNHLINRFNSTEVNRMMNKTLGDEINVSRLHRDIAFDPDAVDSIGNANTRQEEIDLIFNDPSNIKTFDSESSIQATNISQPPKITSENIDDEQFSQSDIDKLFNNQGT